MNEKSFTRERAKGTRPVLSLTDKSANFCIPSFLICLGLGASVFNYFFRFHLISLKRIGLYSNLAMIAKPFEF